MAAVEGFGLARFEKVALGFLADDEGDRIFLFPYCGRGEQETAAVFNAGKGESIEDTLPILWAWHVHVSVDFIFDMDSVWC